MGKGFGEMRKTIGAVFVLVLLSVPTNLTAQQITADTMPPAPPTAETLTNLSAEERAELLSRLSDEQARALLWEYLKAGAGPTADASDSAIEQLEAQSERFQENLIAILGSAPQLPQVPMLVLDRLTEGRGTLKFFLVLLLLAAVLVAGHGGERIFMRTLAPLGKRLATTGPEADFLERFGRVMGLLILDLLGVTLFAATVLALFLLSHQGHEPTRLFFLTLLSALVLFRLVIAVSKAVFGLREGASPLVPLGDEDARTAHRHVVAAGAVGAFGFLGCDLLRMYGLDEQPHRLMTFIVGTLFMLVLLVGVWRARGGIAGAILSRDGMPGPEAGAFQTLVSLWHLPVMFYLLAVYGVAVFSSLSGVVAGTYPAVASILLIAALPLADRVLRGAVERLLGPGLDAGDASHRILRRAIHILVGLVAIIVLAAIWNADIFDVAGAGIGGRIARTILQVALTGFAGYVAWGLLNVALARHMPKEGETEASDVEGGAATTTRLGTVLPLLMRVALISISVIVVLVALSALGVNIGPLLAGAGVIGIAVGFGAQTFVRDVVSGMFFLVDDAFRRGEYVDVGGIMGTVERINMRSLVLRHHLGPMHTVPYGEIQHLTNFSRDWVIVKLEFRVGYDTDVNKVKRIFKQIGQEMLDHPELGKDFIEPFKSQGVKAMEESAMIVRGKFMAKPGTQFSIRKEIYSRVQMAFQENGIEFAHRRVTVDMPSNKDLSPEKKKEIAEAAGAAALADDEEKQVRP
jgi:small-conductance mechanosensitive channel